MVTSGQPTHEPSIYLRPKRNSRIYFTYALLPSYFQLYERGSLREDRSGGVQIHSPFLQKAARADA